MKDFKRDVIMEMNDRQLEIIEAAGKIFTSSGVSGLTIKNLAKEMKFSESAIYRHFASKEDIIISMLNYLSEIINYRLNITKETIDDPETKLTTLFQNHFEFFNNNKHFATAVFSDGLFKESQCINEAILKIMNVKTQHLLPVIMEGQQKGVFTNSITTDEMLHIVMGSVKLQMFKWIIADFQFDIVRAGNNMVQSLLTIIKSKR